MAEGGITGKGFVKGDPRINRKGRPRSFDALRELAQQIAHEVALKDDGDPLVVEKHKATIAEMILRSWASSKNPQLQQAFIEVAFGKVPNVTQFSGAIANTNTQVTVFIPDNGRADRDPATTQAD